MLSMIGLKFGFNHLSKGEYQRSNNPVKGDGYSLPPRIFMETSPPQEGSVTGFLSRGYVRYRSFGSISRTIQGNQPTRNLRYLTPTIRKHLGLFEASLVSTETRTSKRLRCAGEHLRSGELGSLSWRVPCSIGRCSNTCHVNIWDDNGQKTIPWSFSGWLQSYFLFSVFLLFSSLTNDSGGWLLNKTGFYGLDSWRLPSVAAISATSVELNLR